MKPLKEVFNALADYYEANAPASPGSSVSSVSSSSSSSHGNTSSSPGEDIGDVSINVLIY